MYSLKGESTTHQVSGMQSKVSMLCFHGRQETRSSDSMRSPATLCFLDLFFICKSTAASQRPVAFLSSCLKNIVSTQSGRKAPFGWNGRLRFGYNMSFTLFVVIKPHSRLPMQDTVIFLEKRSLSVAFRCAWVFFVLEKYQ